MPDGLAASPLHTTAHHLPQATGDYSPSTVDPYSTSASHGPHSPHSPHTTLPRGLTGNQSIATEIVRLGGRNARECRQWGTLSLAVGLRQAAGGVRIASVGVTPSLSSGSAEATVSWRLSFFITPSLVKGRGPP
jgi:hypothetical protein